MGDNYEYFFKEDLSDLNKIISKAKETLLDNNKYNTYLESVKHIKKLLHPDSISNDIINFLNRINDGLDSIRINSNSRINHGSEVLNYKKWWKKKE